MRAVGIRLAWASMFAAEAFVVGCGGSTSMSNGQPDASSITDSGADVATQTAPDADAATACTASLQDLQNLARCPAAYAAAEDPEQFCGTGAPYAHLSFVEGEGVAVLYVDVGAGGTECIYASTGGALIGIRLGDDIPDFCNHTSNTETAGVQAPFSGVQPLAVDCSPDGASDARAADASADATDRSLGDGSTGCTGALSTLKTYAGCADSYSTEAGAAQLCDGGVNRWINSVQSGDGLTVVSVMAGGGSALCIYSSSDGTLVGVWAASDEPDFCNSTSYVETAGVQAPQGGSTTTLSCHGGADTDSGGGEDSGSD